MRAWLSFNWISFCWWGFFFFFLERGGWVVSFPGEEMWIGDKRRNRSWYLGLFSHYCGSFFPCYWSGACEYHQSWYIACSWLIEFAHGENPSGFWVSLIKRACGVSHHQIFKEHCSQQDSKCTATDLKDLSQNLVAAHLHNAALG